MSWQDEFVQVRNETDHNYEWDGRQYPAGSTSTVPFLNMANSFGDPRAVAGVHQPFLSGKGEKGVIQPREDERNRVQTVWRIGGPDPIYAWDDLPKLSFYTMDGERLFTVAEDPYGEHVTPANLTVDQQQVLQHTVERQQEIINRLLEVSGLDKDALPTDGESVSLPIDLPTDDSTASDTTSPWAHADE